MRRAVSRKSCDWQNEHLSVAHAAGAGYRRNSVERFLHARIVDPQGNLYFRKKGLRVFCFAVFVEIAFLASVPFHFADVKCLDGSQLEGFEHLLGQMFGSTWAVECVAASVDLEPLTVEQALGPGDDPEANAVLQRTLEITGGELVDAPEVRT